MSNSLYRVLLVITIAIAASSCDVSLFKQPNVSNIKADETVVFFRTAAWLDEKTGHWQIPIHGWIYEPLHDPARKHELTRILKEKHDLKVNQQYAENFDYRLSLFLADNERGKQIVISIAGQTFKLPKSTPNGHFKTIISLDSDVVKAHTKNNVLAFSALTREKEKRHFSGDVLLIPPTGYSVISDIDDTVKISHVTDRKKLLEYTFLRDFEAAPGMAKLYRHWQSHNTAFHFVSSSPWQLYSPLLAFVGQDQFPKASFSLKYVRFGDSSFFNLFKKGIETKPAQIEPILQRYPQRKFILVGDSGEQDPEVYAGIIKKYPEQIAKIYIRNVTQAKASDKRFQQLFAGIDNKRWQLFSDATNLEQKPGS